MPVHGLVQDSPVIYVAKKATKKARRAAKSEQVEVFTPEFKARFTNWLDKLDEKSKAMAAEAKAKRRAQ
jgi:hypothetical protein